MKNSIEDLRNNLFVALEHAIDDESKMPVQKLIATAQLGKVILDSAKLELQFLKHKKAISKEMSSFMKDDDRLLE